jgi:VCBS repeat-containing protein
VPTSGTLTYAYTLKAAQNTPGADQSLDPITLKVTDAGGSTANGTLTVRIVDDAPVANPDSVEIGENVTGSTVSGNVVTGSGPSGNVADIVGADGPSGSGAVTAVSFGGTTGTIGSALNGSYGSLTLNAGGSYSYILDSTNPAVEALNPGQMLSETYSYTITDGDGDTSTTTLTITIAGENDAPVVVGGGSSISGVEDDVIVLTLSDFPYSDVDAGDALEAVRIAELPTSGALYLDGVQVLAGGVISVADIAAGKLTYRSAPDGNGPSYASFGYQLGDGISFSATGTMNIEIAPRNDTPTVAGPANATATEDIPLAFDGGSSADHAPVLRIDDLADLTQTGATDLFTLTLAVGHGTLTIADPEGTVIGEGTGASLSLTGTRDALNAALRTLTYLADADYSGADQLLVGLDDHINAGSGAGAEPGTAGHVVDILVRGQGDPPILTANPARGAEDSWVPIDIDVASADLSDPETVGLDLTGLPAGWSIRVGTGEAVLSMDAGQIFRFTAADVAVGLSIMAPANVNSAAGQSITLNLAATSTGGGSAAVTQGQLTVAIDPVNDRPVASGQIILPTIIGVGTSGGTIAELFGGHYTDVTDDTAVSRGAERDTPLAGVAIVGNDATASQGAWQYDLGDGAGWRAIPTSGLGDHSALILPASAQIRFVPAQGFSGQPGGLMVRLSDGTSFPAASATPDALVDLTAIAAGALGDQTGGWSQQTVPVSLAVSNTPADTQAAFLDLPGYDRWGTMFHKREVYDEHREDLPLYLEGRPVDRYTVAWQPISQQMVFRWSGGIAGGKLTYEATLGRNEPLPSWITFNATMQTVTAMPDNDVKPGIYVVRVVARDTAGHEAESALTIHVLRDNAKSMEEIRRRAQGDKARFGAPLGVLDESRENDPRGQAESRAPALPSIRPGRRVARHWPGRSSPSVQPDR